MKARLFSILLLVLFLTAGCGEVPTAPPPAGQSPVSPPTVESYPLAPTWTPRPPRPTATLTPVPTPSPTRTPPPTPLVVQPTPFAPQEPLPEDFPTIIYAVQRPDQPAQIWTLHSEGNMLTEELSFHLSPDLLANNLGSVAAYRGLGYLWIDQLHPSPDGRYIAISLANDIEWTTLLVDRHEATVSLVSIPDEAGSDLLDWIPGTSLFVVATNTWANWWVADVHSRIVTDLPGNDVLDAVVLPGGHRLIFSTNRLGGILLGAIDVDGSSEEEFALPDLPHHNEVRHLTLSPDGQTCAFAWEWGVYHFGGQIWAIDTDGTNPRPLGPEDTFGFDLSWSPNRAALAYARWDGIGSESQSADHDGMSVSLHVLDLQSGEDRILVSSEGGHAHWSPQWLPDGSGLVFLSNRGGDTNVWFVHADGTGLQQLTRQGGLVGEIAILVSLAYSK